MKVAVEILESTREPRRQVQHEQILAMLLRPGTILRRAVPNRPPGPEA
jgi:hypothetical protein